MWWEVARSNRWLKYDKLQSAIDLISPDEKEKDGERDQIHKWSQKMYISLLGTPLKPVVLSRERARLNLWKGAANNVPQADGGAILCLVGTWVVPFGKEKIDEQYDATNLIQSSLFLFKLVGTQNRFQQCGVVVRKTREGRWDSDFHATKLWSLRMRPGLIPGIYGNPARDEGRLA